MNLIAVAALAVLISLASPTLADSEDHGYLGVSLHFTELLHEDGRVASDDVGVFISDVVPDGPASIAGLKANDKIVALDGRPISQPKALSKFMAITRNGERISVTVERDGGEQTFDVILGDRPTKLRSEVARFGALLEYAEDRAFVGVESQAVGPQLARYFGVEGGVLIAKVLDGTPAQEAGIEAGDVIVAWAGTPINDEHDLHVALAKAKPGDQVAFAISRRGAESQVIVTLGSARDHKMRELHVTPDGDQYFDDEHDVRYEIKIREKKGGGE